MSDDEAVTPFRIAVAQRDLDDLAERLARTRWAESETVDHSGQGVQREYLRGLVAYWADGYDWRRIESRLNDLPQHRTQVDGLGIHLIHVRSTRSDATPLLITHGWPGSVLEFLDVIVPLTDPPADQPAFHVVIPSLPGFGFSDKPTRTGWDTARTADAWATLMTRLGYPRFAAQGGDWGSMVTSMLGERHPDRLHAIHLNMPMAPPDPTEPPTDAELEIIAQTKAHARNKTGYMKEQSTRPQTIGYSLVDSPVGLAAWIVEKFWEWTDNDGDLAGVLTRDQLLDAVMMYWLPATGASSARFYWEAAQTRHQPTITVPVGISMFPREIYRTSQRWARRRYPTLGYWNEVSRGGHFAALEQPALFVEEIRSWIRTVDLG